jgi:hypothetical protein
LNSDYLGVFPQAVQSCLDTKQSFSAACEGDTRPFCFLLERTPPLDESFVDGLSLLHAPVQSEVTGNPQMYQLTITGVDVEKSFLDEHF